MTRSIACASSRWTTHPTGRDTALIDVGPENPNFASLLPVANFALGYNEYKAIEVSEVVSSVATGKPAWPTFSDGYEIMQIVDACFESSAKRQWVRV